MKEIDFIPKWYREGQKRKISYHRQYGVITCIFIIMLIWSLVSGKLVSKAKADVVRMQKMLNESALQINEHDQYMSDMAELKEKTLILDKLTANTNISSIIAELTHLINNRIIIKELEVINEAYESEEKHNPSVSLVTNNASMETAIPQESMCQKVIITGIASGVPDVANLISNLEESDYFFRIIPGYSKNKQINDLDVTEFEIRCFVADFKTDKRENNETVN